MVVVAAVMEVDGSEKESAKLTKQVIVCSFIAAFAGLMFGYDIGISGTYIRVHYLLIFDSFFLTHAP